VCSSDLYYQLIVIEERVTTMKKESDNMNITKKNKYIPPADHPWRTNKKY
jgi:hypothetical protein